MKKKIICITIILVLAIFFAYKSYMLIKYRSEKVTLDKGLIFKETLTIENNSNSKTIEEYFEGYEELENNSNFKVKYNDEGEVESFYTLANIEQYVNLLNINSFELYTDDSIKKNYNTEKDMKDYLSKNKINNDIDLLKHIKENYYFKNNLFTCSKTMKNNYILNNFVLSTLPTFKEIVLIDGSINGYIIVINTSSEKPIKEVHILNEDKQYIIFLAGNDITSTEFITELLETVKIY